MKSYYFVSYAYFAAENVLGFGNSFIEIEGTKYFPRNKAKKHIKEKYLDKQSNNPRLCILNYKKISKKEFNLN